MNPMAWLKQYLFGVGVPLLLFGVGAFYFVYLRLLPFRRPLLLIRALRGREGASSAKALALALAGTLGVGNIVGVSAAIALGGFGSIFWMWVSALFAMILKYAEITLAMRHRRYDALGRPYGAAMYYIRDLLKSRGMARAGGLLAGLFALLCVMNSLTMGSMIQVNAVTKSAEGVLGIPPWVMGGGLAIITLVVMRKGTEGAIRLTGCLVPVMTLGFLVLSATVLILRAEAVPNAFLCIFSQAFTTDSAVGGVGGFLLSQGLRYGTMRGLISNEGGCGTAPAAHATSNCRYPAKQGVWGILEVFCDTILLCTVTALCVIVSWGDTVAKEGSFMMMTVRAYSMVLGAPAAVFLSVAVLLFGFATVICWGHYGRESVRYLSRKPWAERGFYLIFSFSVLMGAFAEADMIWTLTDFAVGAMTLINLCLLCLGAREVRRETELWMTAEIGRAHRKQKKA